MLPPIKQAVTDESEPRKSPVAHSTEAGTGRGDIRGNDAGGDKQPEVLHPTTGTSELFRIYNKVAERGSYNWAGARQPVPSGLCIQAWKEHLRGYRDFNLVKFLEFGWPINYDRASTLVSTWENHASATTYPADIQFYIDTERGHGALLGPFRGPPVPHTHISPLMTKPKRDSAHRRVIMDLSWPIGAAINDGIDCEWYIDGPGNVQLPTVTYMEERLLTLGKGAWMYKTDLSRGYRQLRVDPLDWPLLGFKQGDDIYLDVCPPFGLRTSALFMQRTTEAIAFIHQRRGYYSRPYLDDFGGAETTEATAGTALDTLQGIFRDLGIQEAEHKVCRPSQCMVWLGIEFNSVLMTMTVPPAKLEEIMDILQEWKGKTRATKREIQSLIGLLQFVASVTPPARIFTNRMLQTLREAPQRGYETLSFGFKRDLRFFLELLPMYNGVRILDKAEVQFQGQLELDACLSGCGAFTGDAYYSEQFPEKLQGEKHPIAHLEFLNVVVATKVWARQWSGKRVLILCDNQNSCVAINSGRSRDPYMQDCIRELFLCCSVFDIEVVARHKPGSQLVRADALSRAHMGDRYIRIINDDEDLQQASRVRVPIKFFSVENAL